METELPCFPGKPFINPLVIARVPPGETAWWRQIQGSL